MRIWDPASGRIIREIDAVEMPFRTSFSPDGKRLAIAEFNPPVAVVVDVRSGERLFTLQGHDFDLADVDWSPDGRWIATSSHDTTVRIWDARSGKPRFSLFHAGAVGDADWSLDSSRLVTGSKDGTATVWAVSDAGGEELFSLSPRKPAPGSRGWRSPRTGTASWPAM